MKKECSKCGDTKTSANFRPRPANRDGREGVCRECRRVPQKAHKRYTKVARDPFKVRIQNKVRYAVRTGKLIKPDFCTECGEYHESRFIHGHHEDYDQPLAVEWLCHWCHSDRHKPVYE